MKQKLLFLTVAAAFILSAAPKKSNINKLVGVFPEHIKCIAVLSPASRPNEKTIRQGVAMLEKAGIKVKLMPNSFAQNGKRGGTVEQRMADWNAAVNDPEVDMILPTRGGSGAHELLKHIDWKKFKERNLTLLGFSNITYLLCAMEFHQAGHPITGPNLGRLVTATDASLDHLKCVLAKKSPKPITLVPLKPGDAKGKVFGGHLAMLDGNFKSKYKIVPKNRVIFLECVNRDTPTMTKYFDYLNTNGFFDEAAAVVFCHFNKIKDSGNRDEMFEKWAAQLKCPVYKGYPYGHKNSNHALDYKATAVIKDNVLTFELE